MKKTPLHTHHLALDAKMGEFAGYDMPLYYKDGVMKEHEWVRENAGLFDVSHMGQIMLTGTGIAAFWEKLTPSNFTNKSDGRAQYTVLLNDDGGMIDDLIVTRMEEDRFFAVVNAGRKDVDLPWIKQNLPANIALDYWETQGLIALQGPKSEAVVQKTLNVDLSDLPYMHATEVTLEDGTPLLISRLGYTGEDGFEISIAPEKAGWLWDTLLGHDSVKPIGLAARDSLRLDMGYPLYGHDIDETTSPLEADISWIIRKSANDGQKWSPRIAREQQNGITRKRVGVRITGKGIAREGAELRNLNDEKIGILTSGGFSPSLKCAVGQGYIETGHADTGTEIFVNVRGRNIEAVIADMPFVPAQTKSMKPKKAA